MDEHVKARLIGATVLVVIAVALVPELLSGPRQSASNEPAGDGKRGTRVFTIDLGSTANGGAQLQPVPATPATTAARPAPQLPAPKVPGADAERGDVNSPSPEEAPPAEMVAAPAATVASTEPMAPAPAKGATKPSAAAPAEASKPTPAVEEARPATAGQGAWAVQVGAFGSVATARKVAADLKKDGLPAYVSPLSRNGKTLNRVRVGPAPTKADAEKLAARLKSKGVKGSIVAAD